MGAVRVLSGALREDRYVPGVMGLVSDGWTLARAGAFLREPSDRIHCVRNPLRVPAVSLHVYAPPLGE
jgi:hypothetical protein